MMHLPLLAYGLLLKGKTFYIMDKCKSGCPFKVIEDYQNLEKELGDEFAEMIKDWLHKHSYVEAVHIRDDCPFALNSMSISSHKISCTVRLKHK